MPLTPGSRVGPYEVVAKLGEGGMGEVYRARDTKLDRDVALKILPTAFTADPDRLARFEREAKVLASLNHANIAAIHGLEDTTGGHALVMELVEGDDLAQRLARGAIPLDEALSIARQIAEALEAAHEQGIIHRDLKPANIKVTPAGVVKVLDFGLAKAADQGLTSSSPHGLTASPTITTPAMTQAGIILGTAAYMSPEQAKGRMVDKRSDMWAFGVVLYEMLTGRRAFDGEDVSDLLVAVLSKDVDLQALPSGTPPGIAQLLRRCLARDPRQRLRDIGEARIEIGRIEAGATEDAATSAAAVARTPVARARRWGWPLAAAAALAALLVSVLWPALRPAPAAPVRILDVPDTTGAQFLALSPDGTMIAYATSGGLHLRRLDAAAATRLVDRGDVGSLTFSPDGESIAYYTTEDVRVVRRDGSGGRTLFRHDFRNDVQLAWVGEAIYWPANDGIRRVPIAGGESTLVAPVAAIQSRNTPLRHPVVLEGGRTILVNPGLGGEGRFDFGTVWAFREGRAIEVLSLQQTVIDALSFDAASGMLLITATDRERRAVWKAPFDIASLTAGPAQPLLDGGRQSSPSADGTLALLTGVGGGSAPVDLEWRGPDGSLVRTVSQRLHDLRGFSLSPDGRRLAVRGVTEIGAAGGLWVFDLETGVPSLVSPDIANFADSTWSPDGRRLAFVDGDRMLRVVTVGATQPPRVLEKGAVSRSLPAWTPDGRRILFSRFVPGRAAEIVEIDPDGAGPAKVLGTIDAAGSVSVSPNGRWVAYESAGAVSVTDYPALAMRETVSGDRSAVPQWSPDGSAVWFVKGGDFVSVSVKEAGGRLIAAPARVLWSAPPGTALYAPLGRRGFGTIDGRHFLVRQARVLDTSRVTIIQNLTALLKDRPAGR